MLLINRQKSHHVHAAFRASRSHRTSHVLFFFTHHTSRPHYSPIAHRTALASSKACYFKLKFKSCILFTKLKNFSNNKSVSHTLAELIKTNFKINNVDFMRREKPAKYKSTASHHTPDHTLLCEVRGVRCEVWGVRCEVWGARCEVWGVRCEVWGVKCEVWGVTCDVWRVMWDL